MKANELNGKDLMIGDYVYGCIETDIVDEAKYRILCKVKEINDYGDIVSQCIEPLPDELDWQDGGDFSWIEPVPLEKIHLAKNGFTADEEDETFIYEDGYEVRVYFDGGCKELELEPYIYLNINFAEKHLSMEIANLHQLQQAMRIMGCDKTIEV